VALARVYPDKLVLGMEIRAKVSCLQPVCQTDFRYAQVTEYVKKRIEASREESPGQFQNAGVLR
jgi:hypothetical protein